MADLSEAAFNAMLGDGGEQQLEFRANFDLLVDTVNTGVAKMADLGDVVLHGVSQDELWALLRAVRLNRDIVKEAIKENPDNTELPLSVELLEAHEESLLALSRYRLALINYIYKLNQVSQKGKEDNQ